MARSRDCRSKRSAALKTGRTSVNQFETRIHTACALSLLLEWVGVVVAFLLEQVIVKNSLAVVASIQLVHVLVHFISGTLVPAVRFRFVKLEVETIKICVHVLLGALSRPLPGMMSLGLDVAHDALPKQRVVRIDPCRRLWSPLREHLWRCLVDHSFFALNLALHLKQPVAFRV